ncbi:kelch repeat-containing protein [Aurantibacillus circumpalustris]|uniref:kelch repeat-containing protein n=1 Tax=Aurantibacillus circumpalustris TaxID=3036359 RepID=UPI00295B0D29|nr:kelch repeat-containing protein [Aurantibacillus circumpalustris]
MKTNKSKKTSLFYALCFAFAGITQAQNYTWMKGSNTVDQSGLYGTLGVPASTNNPGSRDGACQWKDASGNFWLFGGYGYDAAGNYDILNDLWKYTLSTNQWTWIGGDSIVFQDGVYGTMGVPSSINKPGSRSGAVTWTDLSGNLWMFGGYAVDAFSSDAEMNDLWKYNITTNQWTWTKGSNAISQLATFGSIGVAANSNVPGSAIGCTSWTDASGNLWLFGGIGNDATTFGNLNDLWKYNITSNQWTWVKGSGIIDQNGVYGTVSVPSISNLPGGRFIANSWADAAGNLWLFGGSGFDVSSSSADFLNDLWKYSITTNQWTWVKGSNIISQGGTYGTLGVGAPTNVPGARIGSLSWKQPNGDFYLFGGIGYYTPSNFDNMNDLWKYSSLTNEWTWIKGSNNTAVNGTYGTQGISAPANTPGARGSGSSWVDNSGNLWSFGGSGIDATAQSFGELNDLWKFSICTSPNLTITALQPTICAGVTTSLSVSGANTYTWNTLQNSSVIAVAPTINTTYTVIGTFTNTGCSNSLFFTQEVYPIKTISVTSNRGANVCKGESGNYTATGATTYTWSNGNTGPVATVSFSNIGLATYTCTYTDSNGCVNTSTVNKNVNACTNIDDTKNSVLLTSVYPNPSNGVFNISTPHFEGAQLMIFNAVGQKVIEQTLVSEKTEIESTLQKGIYIYQVIQNNKRIGNGKLIIE